MAASVSGAKVVTVDLSPTHTAAKLTTLYATPPEQLTFGNLMFLVHCCALKQGAEDPSFVIGTLTT